MPMALIRPIEINTYNNSCVCTVGGGANTTCEISTGGYANILAVMRAFETEINAEMFAGQVDVYLSTDWKVVIHNADVLDNGTLTIDWDGGAGTTDTDLRDMIGFTANLSITHDSTSTATYTPQYCWLPTYEAADPEAWVYSPIFSGATSVSGALSGLALADGRYTRTPKWPVEKDTNSRIARATTTYEQVRCFEQFVNDVKTAAPTATTTEGINLKGFYLIHDRSVYTGSTPTVAIPTTMTSGGVDTELAAPDRYVYCSIEAGTVPDIALSTDGQQLYYDCSVPIHTATAPTWNRP